MATIGDAIVAALRVFGFDDPGITANDFNRSNRVVQLGVPPNRIDLITSIAGVPCDRAWAGRTEGSIDGVPVASIGFEDLIRIKESAGRSLELGDAETVCPSFWRQPDAT